MASIHTRPDGTLHLSFRFGGRQFKPSLKTKDRREAEQTRARVEETIKLLETGRITLPANTPRAEILQFILSGGKQTHKPTLGEAVNVKTAVEEYLESYTVGKEPVTIAGEKIHLRHFQRLLGEKTPMRSITTDKLQSYVAARSKENGLRKKTVRGETIRKEFRTFTQLWSMAVRKGYVTGPCPSKGVRIHLPDEKMPFKTWEEMEAIVKREGVKEEEKKAYWDCLFLDEAEVLEFVDYVEKVAAHPFIHAAIAFAAFTGARRSEVIRSQIEDWDLQREVVRIREKKGSRKKNTTFREVVIHPRLAEIMKKWFALHPGGLFTIAVPPGFVNSKKKQEGPAPMTPEQAHDFFDRTIAGSKWAVLRGWHVLRHSFCSNCARRGIPDTIIDAWMGHRGNEDIKKRYRHLFPTDTQKYMGVLFSEASSAGHGPGST